MTSREAAMRTDGRKGARWPWLSSRPDWALRCPHGRIQESWYRCLRLGNSRVTCLWGPSPEVCMPRRCLATRSAWASASARIGALRVVRIDPSSGADTSSARTRGGGRPAELKFVTRTPEDRDAPLFNALCHQEGGNVRQGRDLPNPRHPFPEHQFGENVDVARRFPQSSVHAAPGRRTLCHRLRNGASRCVEHARPGRVACRSECSPCLTSTPR